MKHKIGYDNTERKRAEETIKGQLHEIASFYDYAPIGLAMLDADLRFLRINQRLAEMNGLSPAEHIGKKVEDIVPSLAAQARSITAEIIQTGKPKENIEFVGETDAEPGIRHIWREGWYPLKNERGQIIGFEVMVEDITERKQAEEALRLSEQRFHLLTESIPQLVWSARADGVSDYYNAPFLQYLGKTLEEMQGWVWVETLHPDDRERSSAMWTQAFRSGSNYEIEYRIRRAADGQYRWHLGRAVPLRDSSGEIVRWYGTCTDIHDRKQAEEEIRRYVAQMETLARRLVETRETEQRAIGRELHDEIGQALTGLRFSLQTSASLQLEEKQVYITMINDLISRLRNMSLDLRPAMLDDLGLLPTLLWHIDKFSQQTKIAVEFQHSGIDRRFTPELEISAFRMVQEALTNVARHAQADRARVRIWSNPERLQILVEDPGVGFHVNGIADAYKTNGLIGMRERAMALGGNVSIESVPGTGTRLYAELPLNAQAKEANDDPNHHR